MRRRSAYTESMRLVAMVVVSGALVLAQAPTMVRVPMRDGVRLSTNMFLPGAPVGIQRCSFEHRMARDSTSSRATGCSWIGDSRSSCRMCGAGMRARECSSHLFRRTAMAMTR